MDHGDGTTHEYYDLSGTTIGEQLADKPPQFVRWIQPPQIAYFVTSVDKAGNINSTPVTMGTTMNMSDGFYIPFGINVAERHIYANLAEIPECVISYIGANLIAESWIAGLPIPKGISELDVARLTPLPSRKVRPCGIAECGVNMEARIVSMQELGTGSRMFMAKVVAVSVDRELPARNEAAELRTGVLAIDPLFEVLIERSSPSTPDRLYYAKLETDALYRTSDEIGSTREWIGSFADWLASEEGRGRIDGTEREDILRLNEQWSADPDPARNGQARDALTRKLRDMVWRPKEDWPGPGRAA